MLIPGVRAHDYPKNTPSQLFLGIARDGWQTIQLAFAKAIAGVGERGVTPQLIEETEWALKESGLSIGVLGAYYEPALADEPQREASVRAFCNLIPVAQWLGAGCIATETTSMDKQPAVTRPEALRHLRRSMEQMLAIAEQYDVTIGVEPVYCHSLSTPEETRALLDDMGSSRLKVVFDPVNLLSPALASAQHDLWARCFDAFGEDIVAVHIKGVRFERGAQVDCALEDSIVDYAALLGPLGKLPGPIPLLREGLTPKHAASDLAFMKALM